MRYLRDHPEIDDIKIKEMILLRDHFIKFGNPLDQALLKAERAMIDDGVLIDHEAVAAAKEAAQRQSAAKEAEEENTAAAKQKRDVMNMEHQTCQQQGDMESSYAPAAGGRVNVQTGAFQAKAAGGYVDTQTGAFHTKAAGGTVNTQTGESLPRAIERRYLCCNSLH